MGGAHASPGEYKEPHLPEGVLEIRISVYKLGLTGVGFLDSLGSSLVGAYHSALVVAGEEWSYGGHEEDCKTGVYRCRPEVNPEYIFYQRIVMARVDLSRREALKQAHALAHTPEWSGARYDLIEHNCNHFASDLCWLLARKRPPDWINDAADGLAKRRRRKRAEESALADSLFQYRSEHAPAMLLKYRAPPESTDQEPDAEPEADSQVRDAPGAVAFQDTFTTTFEMAWSQRREERRARTAACQAGQDPQALKLQVEKESLDAAASAAITAAWVVASAARAAAAARAEQPPAGLRAWDAAWAQQSGPLLRKWREAAVRGALTPSGTADRHEEVGVALAIAAVAASEAAQAMQPLPVAEEALAKPSVGEKPHAEARPEQAVSPAAVPARESAHEEVDLAVTAKEVRTPHQTMAASMVKAIAPPSIPQPQPDEAVSGHALESVPLTVFESPPEVGEEISRV